MAMHTGASVFTPAEPGKSALEKLRDLEKFNIAMLDKIKKSIAYLEKNPELELLKELGVI